MYYAVTTLTLFKRKSLRENGIICLTIIHIRYAAIVGIPCRRAGLARLEYLYSIVNKRQQSMAVDAVRLTDVGHSYMTLRQIDSRRSTGSKYIVLDLSTDGAVQTVLKQVI